jgi:hypothetical protein
MRWAEKRFGFTATPGVFKERRNLIWWFAAKMCSEEKCKRFVYQGSGKFFYRLKRKPGNPGRTSSILSDCSLLQFSISISYLSKSPGMPEIENLAFFILFFSGSIE